MLGSYAASLAYREGKRNKGSMSLKGLQKALARKKIRLRIPVRKAATKSGWQSLTSVPGTQKKGEGKKCKR